MCNSSEALHWTENALLLIPLCGIVCSDMVLETIDGASSLRIESFTMLIKFRIVKEFV